MPERKFAATRTTKPRATAASSSARTSPDPGKPPTGTARQRILLIASTKFAQHGFEAVSTGEIARAADMSQAIIHYHFGTKEELWRESITFMMADLDQRFPLHMSELRDLDPLMRLK